MGKEIEKSVPESSKTTTNFMHFVLNASNVPGVNELHIVLDVRTWW